MVTAPFDIQMVIIVIMKLFLVVGVGYLLYTFGLIKKEATGSLASLIINICFPALIFTRMITTFDPADYPDWGVLAASSIAISCLGLGLGYLATRLFKGFQSDREFMGCCAFQNGAYLPVTLIAFLPETEITGQLIVSIFIFMMGFNLAVWSFLPWFLSRGEDKKFNILAVLNAPVIAVIGSMLYVYFLGQRELPQLLFDPLAMLGETTFPLTLIALGALFAEHKGFQSKNWMALLSCLGVKLILMPILLLLFLKSITWNSLFEFVLFFEVIMPTATTLVVIGEKEDADNQFISGMIFYSHLLSIVTIPLWLFLFGKFA